jgi:hypothetical protein
VDAPGGAKILTRRFARRPSLLRGGVFGSRTIVGAGAHPLFGEDQCMRLLTFVKTIQETSA